MNIEQIRYALEISRVGSINKAAKNLFSSQSNLSTGIKKLEDELMFTIFNRLNKGIELTEIGQEFY